MANKVTVKTIQKLKNNGEKITMITSYDYSTAKYVDQAGIDMILVGDSLAMVVLGYENTNAIGMEEMKIFTKAVVKGASRSIVVADMPFMSYHTDIPTAIKNCGEIIKLGANAVKIEGGSDYIVELVKRLTECGIPVVAHVGFTPQSQNIFGGFVVQGKSVEATKEIYNQVKKLEQAGAFAVVLELVPEESAKYITERTNIATIGIGAGRYCDGQVLVCDDLFGKFSDFKPKFARRYGDMQTLITECASSYNRDVKNGNFPNEDEVFHLPQEEAKLLEQESDKECCCMK